MATETGGYRQYKKKTVTATTDTHDFDPLPDGHKVYIDLVGMRSSRANADVIVYLVSGGEEFFLGSHKNVSANLGEIQEIRTWMYTGEFVRFYWSGIQANDTVEASILGVDKWEKEAT